MKDMIYRITVIQTHESGQEFPEVRLYRTEKGAVKFYNTLVKHWKKYGLGWMKSVRITLDQTETDFEQVDSFVLKK